MCKSRVKWNLRLIYVVLSSILLDPHFCLLIRIAALQLVSNVFSQLRRLLSFELVHVRCRVDQLRLHLVLLRSFDLLPPLVITDNDRIGKSYVFGYSFFVHDDIHVLIHMYGLLRHRNHGWNTTNSWSFQVLLLRVFLHEFNVSWTPNGSRHILLISSVLQCGIWIA